METLLYPNADEQTRRDMLESEAFKVVDGEKYDRRLSDAEIEDRRHEAVKLLDKQDELAVEKKEVMDDFKARASSLNKKLSTLRQEARTGVTNETGKLYYIPDYDARRMGIYNGAGELINSRGLLPEERQQNMFASRGGASGTEG
ncbi:hypothetical protein [Hymenobacter metallicola]|uniref:Uncharacterized protein n=1 Tax=Hymenobacter metallicola TaxID=2563114 RepID=A0A4Z0QKH7_9BACT|nr:hypothetical protein [Hymenobacter metallicola]TGE29759.1 hypothetical protein E5K02_09955 [Hymenobacter metallicola]